MMLVHLRTSVGDNAGTLEAAKKCRQGWNAVSSVGSACTVGNYRCRGSEEDSEEDSEATSGSLGKSNVVD